MACVATAAAAALVGLGHEALASRLPAAIPRARLLGAGLVVAMTAFLLLAFFGLRRVTGL